MNNILIDEATVKLALEALEYIHEGANNQGPHTGISWRCVSNKAEPAITAIREALADSALERMAENARELGLDYEPPCKTGSQCTSKCQQCEQPAQQQEPVRLRRGNILRCIETDELCTVWSTSTTGKTLVKWNANEFGAYTAEQIGELFWLEPEPDDLELAAEKSDNYAAFHAGYRFAVAHSSAEQPAQQEPVAWHEPGAYGNVTVYKKWANENGWLPLYTAPPASKPWVGLSTSDLDEIDAPIRERGSATIAEIYRAIEAKLKEKNHG